MTLHVPLLPATTGLIGAAQLAMMKKGAVLIQASRGGVVDEAALAQSLRSGHLGGAAVDVYSTEPPPADNPLLALDGEAAQRLLLTPHIAGVTRQSWGISVPHRVGKCRTRVDRESAAAEPRVLKRGLFHRYSRTFGHRAPSRDVVLKLPGKLLRRTLDHVIAELLDPRLHLRRR